MLKMHIDLKGKNAIPYGRKQRVTKDPLDEGERVEWKKLA